MNAPRLFGALVVLFCASISEYCSGGLILELSPFQQVSGPEVMLKDIVKDPSSLPDTWRDRPVMKAPANDTPVEYGISAVASALQKYPDMQEVTLRGQVKMSVTRAGQALPLDQIEKAIQKYVSQNDTWRNQKVEIRCDPVNEKLSLSGNEPDFEVTSSKSLKKGNKHSFMLTVSEDGTEKQNLSVTASVTPMIEAWVAKRMITRGQTLFAMDNVETQFLPSDSSDSIVPASEPIDGLEINNTINANQPLNRNSLVQPVCSQNGEQLNVNAEHGNLRIMMRAKALSTGRKGERIMCMNEQSKRRLLVRLTGPKEAKVDF